MTLTVHISSYGLGSMKLLTSYLTSQSRRDIIVHLTPALAREVGHGWAGAALLKRRTGLPFEMVATVEV